MTTAYPLSWPPGFPRAKHREPGKFRTSIKSALENVRTSLIAFGRDSHRPVDQVVISSNVTLGVEKPADPGVAVWFVWEGEQRCIAVDRYTTPEGNLQAIHHVLEARRVELRHGTLHLVKASFEGFKALPAPKGEHWTEILGIAATATSEQIQQRHRELAKSAHPDAGGSAERMARINRARDEALKERGA